MIRKAAPGVIAASKRRAGGGGGVSTFFGSSSGHTTTAGVSAGFKIAQKFTCPGNGTAEKGRIWYAGNGPALMALYADSSGSPGALVCQSASVSYPGSAGYVDFPFTTTPSLTNGTSYWVCVLAPSAIATVGVVLSPAQLRYYNNDSASFTNPFGTLSGGDTVATYDMGAYVLI